MITKEQYRAYEGVRRSGVCNMFDWEAIQSVHPKLTDAILGEIMRTYRELVRQYDPKRNKELEKAGR